MRNFQRLAEGVATAPLLNSIMRQDLWDKCTLRTSHELSPHRDVSDILLRFNEIPKDIAQVVDDCECVDFPAMKQLPMVRPILFGLMRDVEGERLGRVVISRLAPGKTITPHKDGGAPATYYERYQIPLLSAPGCLFRCEDEVVQMRAGDVWWFRNDLEHEVINNSAEDRISLIVDVRTMQ